MEVDVQNAEITVFVTVPYYPKGCSPDVHMPPWIKKDRELLNI